MAIANKKRIAKRTKQIREGFSRIENADIMGRQILAAQIEAFIEETEKYGEKYVEDLAEVVGKDPSTLYAYAKVARGWTREEIECLLRPDEKGSPLTWSHFIKAARVVDRDLRDQLLREAKENRWSCRKFGEEVKERLADAELLPEVDGTAISEQSAPQLDPEDAELTEEPVAATEPEIAPLTCPPSELVADLQELTGRKQAYLKEIKSEVSQGTDESEGLCDLIAALEEDQVANAALLQIMRPTDEAAQCQRVRSEPTNTDSLSLAHSTS